MAAAVAAAVAVAMAVTPAVPAAVAMAVAVAPAVAAAVPSGPPKTEGGTASGGAKKHGKAKATMMWPGGLGGTVFGTLPLFGATLPLFGTVFGNMWRVVMRGATLPLVGRIAVILPTPVATTAVAVVGTVAVVGRMIPTSTETTSHAQQH